MNPSFFKYLTAIKAADFRAYSFLGCGFPMTKDFTEVELSGNLMMHLKQMLLV